MGIYLHVKWNRWSNRFHLFIINSSSRTLLKGQNQHNSHSHILEPKSNRGSDPSTYETFGLCNGIPLRIHNDPLKELHGATRAQEDWSKFVAPVVNYKGGLGAQYSFIRVTVPECLPERLEILSYANESAFLYDDAMEKIDLKKTNQDDEELLDVFRSRVLDQSLSGKPRGEKQIQSQILSEMMAIDHVRAMTTMKAWGTFIQQAATPQRVEHFMTLKDYLPYRIIDAGEMIWFGTVTFGMALTIPDEELGICRKLVMPAFAVLSLTNDLFSWEKELKAAKQSGLSHVINAIWVIMQESSVAEEEAKRICEAQIKEYVVMALEAVQTSKNDPNISKDVKTYVEATLYSCSGNLVWSDVRGLSRHLWDVPYLQLTGALEALSIAEFIYLALAGLVKLSVLLFYRRIFSVAWLTIHFINISIAFTALAYTTFLFVTIFECIPVRKS
ncbi:hypothetical protein B7494_g5555 [Chlorociboria aeruginascens]|nr:hypothetical protein B7494_g5555 [Chlorociboria aeruginascens]